ncbi:Arsenate-mycothiol transferase ArsC2 [Pseudodesulfovibrio hydrargyri]|uniref:Arsenate-mycothiol transferase ArsC2 n=1 Tax=Pseudodesulfovibrio hydrargyri TaxID=2125990 RepID=A0A1J5MZN1_9BACT|nr:arsenate reductase ArsC [Pseudodesulfovibrio hydrargyri]OIQ51300.1 Arsenate-mycothiol transferase ArsC2 [Pseudodesulfovibrio hydrargyri]
MDRIRVLFVCRHNSGRSQIAEAFLTRFGQGRFEARSAGTEPTAVDPLVIQAMAEVDVDLRGKAAADVRDLLHDSPPYHYVITTSGPDVLKDLPQLPARTARLNWAFPDPEYVTGSKDEQLAAARAIRDDIRTQVIRFLNDF